MTTDDLINQWDAERCVRREGVRSNTAELHADFVDWCEQQGISGTPSLRAFGTALSGLGFAPHRHNRRSGFVGIAVKRADGSEPPPAPVPAHVATRSVRAFLKTHAVIEPGNKTLKETTRVIHKAYRAWAAKAGHPAI